VKIEFNYHGFYLRIAQFVVALMCMMLFILGASIIACRGTSRHIVVLEEDRDIFKAILEPMKKTTPAVAITQPLPPVEESQDPDSMTIMARKFSRKTPFSKCYSF